MDTSPLSNSDILLAADVGFKRRKKNQNIKIISLFLVSCAKSRRLSLMRDIVRT